MSYIRLIFNSLRTRFEDTYLAVELWPIKSHTYYLYYLNNVNNITRNRELKSIWFVGLVLFILLLMSFKSGFFLLYPLTDMERNLWYDAIYLFRMPNTVNLTGVFLNLVIVIFIYKLYLVNDKTIAYTEYIVDRVLVDRDDSYFLYRTYKNKSTTIFIRKRIQFIMNGIQFFLFAIRKLINLINFSFFCFN